MRFIRAVSPTIVLIGVGENNKFGHPNISTIENLKLLNTKIYRTDENGEIVIKVNNKSKIKIRKKCIN